MQSLLSTTCHRINSREEEFLFTGKLLRKVQKDFHFKQAQAEKLGTAPGIEPGTTALYADT